MQCEEFEDRLNAVLDERRRPEWDAELRLHCETCAECRQLAASYDALLDGFYALATPEAAGRHGRSRVGRAWDRVTARARAGRVAVASLAMAACVLVVVVARLRSPSRGTDHEPAAYTTVRRARGDAPTGGASQSHAAGSPQLSRSRLLRVAADAEATRQAILYAAGQRDRPRPGHRDALCAGRGRHPRASSTSKPMVAMTTSPPGPCR